MSNQYGFEAFERASGSSGGDRLSQRALSSRAKRAMDIALASAGLVFLSPLLMGIALWIRLTDNGPALFSQQRFGVRGRVFDCYKFRTMVVDAEHVLDDYLAANPEAAAEWARDHKLRNDPRITRIGKFLRKSSLDEFPQLFNILRGEMSVVGPRPIVEAEISKYGSSFAAYCSARPGLTGLWQVSGRSHTTYKERVEMDVAYVTEWSIWRDFWIVLETVPAVLFKRGAF